MCGLSRTVGILGALEQVSGGRTPLKHPCSRPISREIRKKVDDDILSVPLKQHGIEDYTVPQNCPFLKENNMWAYHEGQKRRKRLGGQLTWECGICGKKFKSEHYLDLHMETQHMSQVTGSVCLADYCSMFGMCEEKTYTYATKKPTLPEDEICNEEEQRRARVKCDESVRLCFPLDSKARLINIELKRNLCAMMSCEIKKQFKAEEHGSLISTVALAIAVFVFFMVLFGIVLCCVDYSEDIVAAVMDCRLIGSGFLGNFIRTRDQTRKACGVQQKTRKQI